MARFVLGRSLIKRRVYVAQDIPVELSSKYANRGYEVVPIEPLRFLQMKTDRGLCSPPFNGYSAHHCFAPMTESAVGKKYIAEYNGQQISGEVTKDYVKTADVFWRAACSILSFFHVTANRCIVRDVVEVSVSFKAEGQIAGVLSAGTASGTYALFSWPKLDEGLVGRKFRSLSYDVELKKIVEWTGEVLDVVVMSVYDVEDIMQVAGYLTKNDVKVKPGYSGSPMLI